MGAGAESAAGGGGRAAGGRQEAAGARAAAGKRPRGVRRGSLCHPRGLGAPGPWARCPEAEVAGGRGGPREPAAAAGRGPGARRPAAAPPPAPPCRAPCCSPASRSWRRSSPSSTTGASACSPGSTTSRSKDKFGRHAETPRQSHPTLLTKIWNLL